MPNLPRTVAIPLLASLLLAAAAHAEGQSAVSREDFDTWVKIRNARVAAEARRSLRPGNQSAPVTGDPEYQKALSASGWSEEKLSEVEGNVQNVAQAIRTAESAEEAEMKQAAQQQLKEEFDQPTVALIRSRMKDLDEEPVRQRAEAEARAKKDQAAKGRAPSAKELQGTWKFDADATTQHISETMKLPAEALEKMRETFAKNVGEASYTFKGDTIEARSKRPGASEDVSKGTFRVEGNDLITKDRRGKERKLTVGLKSASELILSMMGMGTIYKKQ